MGEIYYIKNIGQPWAHRLGPPWKNILGSVPITFQLNYYSTLIPQILYTRLGIRNYGTSRAFLSFYVHPTFNNIGLTILVRRLRAALHLRPGQFPLRLIAWNFSIFWVVGRCWWLWSGYGYKFEGKCWALPPTTSPSCSTSRQRKPTVTHSKGYQWTCHGHDWSEQPHQWRIHSNVLDTPSDNILLNILWLGVSWVSCEA
jgi:hypothetical protein